MHVYIILAGVPVERVYATKGRTIRYLPPPSPFFYKIKLFFYKKSKNKLFFSAKVKNKLFFSTKLKNKLFFFFKEKLFLIECLLNFHI